MKNYIFLIVFFLTPLSAVGEAGAIFLLIAPGAAAASTGEAQVAKANDSYASYYNPAGLAFQRSFGVAGMHVNWLPNLADDLYYEFLSFKQPKASGTFGGHLIYLNLGDQMGTDELGNETGVFKSYMWAATGSYGTKITNNSSIGINFKVFHQKLADSGTGSEGGDPYSTDFAFDIGYLKKFNHKKTSPPSNEYSLDLNEVQDQDFGEIFRELSSIYDRQISLNQKNILVTGKDVTVETDNSPIVNDGNEASNDSLVAQIDVLSDKKETLENSLSDLTLEYDSFSSQIETSNTILSNLYLNEPLEYIINVEQTVEYQSEEKKYFGDHQFLQENNVLSSKEDIQISGISIPDFLGDTNKAKYETEGELDNTIMSFSNKSVEDVKSEIEILFSQNDIALDEAKSTQKIYKKLSSYVRSSTFPTINAEIKNQIKAWDIIVKKRTEIKSYFAEIEEGILLKDLSSSDLLFFIANSQLIANETTDWNFSDEMIKEKKKLTNKQYAYFSDLMQLLDIESILSPYEYISFPSTPFYGIGLWKGSKKVAETSTENPDFSDWSSQIETLQNTISNLNDALDQVSADIDFKMNQVSTIERELESTYGLLEEENKKVKNLKVVAASLNIQDEDDKTVDEQFEILTKLSDLLTEFSINTSLATYYSNNNILVDLSESLERLMTEMSSSKASSSELKELASKVATNLENLIFSENEFMDNYSQTESNDKDDYLTSKIQEKEKGEFNFGFTISNIGPEIDFVDADQADPSPTNLRFGVYKEFIINRYHKLNLLFDINRLMVAKYAAMDIDGDGIIDINTNEEGYSDPWYKAIVTCWLDDWYYDYDRDLDDDDVIGGRLHIDGQYLAFTQDNQEFTNPEATNPGYETSQFSGATGAWWSSVGCPGGVCNQTASFYYNGYNFTDVEFLDTADEFVDDNGDGIWNPPEPFYDVGDGIFSEFSGYSDDLSDYQYIINNGEYWIYYNTFDSQSAIVKVEVSQIEDDINTITGIDWGNGSREVTEGYIDWDGDGNYDQGELWTEDVNENGTYNTSYSALNRDGTQEVGSGDNYSIKDELKELIANIGMEYWYTDNFAIRAGYIYDKEGNIMNPTFGAGIRFGQYGFDFGYTAGATDHARANTMFFSISMGL